MASKGFRLVSKYDSMNAARRSTHEDASLVRDRVDVGDVEDRADSLMAIFDGHGGREGVDFISNAFLSNLYHMLKNKKDEDLLRILTSTFLLTDINMRTRTLKTGDVSGSTGVVCLIRKDKEDIYAHIANCGDSRLVISENGIAKRLSNDHVSDEKFELHRIQSSLGFVQHGRTCGVLAVARSFGDQQFKKYVPPQPDVISYRICSQKNPFLVLACDGVWDVMTDQECITMVQEILSSSQCSDSVKEEDLAAERIVKEAEKRGSTDNLSAIVVFF